QLAAIRADLPSFVQNRCSGRPSWDRTVRRLCREKGIVYQGFSLVTPHSAVLRHPVVAAIAARLQATPPQVLFAFARAIGMVVITGTTNQEHMFQNLMTTVTVSQRDVRALEGLRQ